MELNTPSNESLYQVQQPDAVSPSVNNWANLFIETTNPQTSGGRLIYAFIYRDLRRFGLEGDISVNAVLNEVFIRGHTQLSKGSYKITNPEAWIKAVAYRYIRESARQKMRLQDFEDFDNIHYKTEEESDYRLDDISALREALTRLSPLDQLLLNLKVVECKSWPEIRQIMIAKGFSDKTEATWRKAKERAISSLRKKFYELQNNNSV